MTDEKPLVPVQGVPEDLDAFHVATGAYGGQPRAEQGKPLHVRVAEALGWRAFRSKYGYWIVTHGDTGESCEAGFDRKGPTFDPDTGKKLPESVWWEDCGHVPCYDADWAATGPLIERFVNYIEKLSDEGTAHAYGARWWSPEFGEMDEIIETGPTILVAACNLIIALHEAGRLPR